MRILFAQHWPLTAVSAGPGLAGLAGALADLGHTVRCLDVGEAAIVGGKFPVRTVTCRRGDATADVPIDRPDFAGAPGARAKFLELRDDELAHYRQVLRQVLDAEIADFDPQIVHCAHIWLLGHLALESGVPYVVSAHAAELAEYRLDSRYQRLTEEAAENAGRLLVGTTALQQEITSALGDPEQRVLVVPCVEETQVSAQCARTVADLFGQVLNERLGHAWDG